MSRPRRGRARAAALFDGEQRAHHVGFEDAVVVVLGDVLQRREDAVTGVGEEDVDEPSLFLEDGVEAIQIIELSDIPLDAARAPSCAKRFAVASSMPLLAPVTTAIRPSS